MHQKINIIIEILKEFVFDIIFYHIAVCYISIYSYTYMFLSSHSLFNYCSNYLFLIYFHQLFTSITSINLISWNNIVNFITNVNFINLYISVKYLDNIPDDVITELNIPTGAPLVYYLDENLKPIPHKDAIAPLQVQKLKCFYDVFMVLLWYFVYKNMR